MSTVSVRLRKRSLTFHVDNPDDTVQKVLCRGAFYERAQLDVHRHLVFRRSTVLDIGSNVGNHAVFYACSGAARVYAFEPNPRARALLAATVRDNDLATIDLRHAEYGLGASSARARVRNGRRDNLGTAQLDLDAAGSGPEVEVRALDDLDLEGPVSLMKVDVESMELEVLAGAERTIAEHRPALAVEVDVAHLDPFWRWVDAHRYQVVHVFRPYRANVNYVCVPRG